MNIILENTFLNKQITKLKQLLDNILDKNVYSYFIFWSRAKWNYNFRSDIDLWIWKKEKIELPEFLKIKRIAYLDEKSNKEVNIKDPEEKIIYALWTKNAFYRYAKNGLKDKVEFKERLDSTNSTSLNTILFYKDTNNKERMYMNNYLEGEDNLYVSTIDVNPFPLESENPIIPFGTAIIWEKLNPSKKFLNLSIKLEFIGSKGFSHKEITNMEKETGLIKKMISDYQNENKSQ